jgi:hypothetical protein
LIPFSGLAELGVAAHGIMDTVATVRNPGAAGVQGDFQDFTDRVMTGATLSDLGLLGVTISDNRGGFNVITWETAETQTELDGINVDIIGLLESGTWDNDAFTASTGIDWNDFVADGGFTVDCVSNNIDVIDSALQWQHRPDGDGSPPHAVLFD